MADIINQSFERWMLGWILENDLITLAGEPELVDRLNQLVGNRALSRKLGENAYDHARRNYTIERYTESLLGLVRSHFGIV